MTFAAPISVSESLKSTHARYAAYAAARLGYSFRSLDGDDGYLFEVSNGARKALYAGGAGSPFAFNDSRAASLAKDKAFAATALAEAGLPSIPGQVFFITDEFQEMRAPGRELADAFAFAETAAYPLFVKPLNGSSGLDARRVDDAASFREALRSAAKRHFAMLVQPCLSGREHRVFVLEGRPLFSYEKMRPVVVGDGVAVLRALAGASAHALVTGRDAAGGYYRAEDIPEAGVRVEIEGPANRAVGGGAIGFSDSPAPILARLALDAAAVIGLQCAGVDIFDLSPEGDFSRLAVIEVNSNPMFKTLEDVGRWDLIVAIWARNFELSLR